MAMEHHHRLLILAPLLGLLALSVAAAAPSTPEHQSMNPHRKRATPVLVELYSESLCPYCSAFILNHLSKFFTNGLIHIVELRIIPYGNARTDYSTGNMICQHGPDECKLNIIQTCAIRLWPSVSDWFPFVYCLEALPRATAGSTWKNCSSTIPDIKLVEQCYEGPTGLQLEIEFAKLTDSLNPPHRYVPWVLVNKKPLFEDYGNVERYICDAYKGKKPGYCNTIADSPSFKSLLFTPAPKKSCP